MLTAILAGYDGSLFLKSIHALMPESIVSQILYSFRFHDHELDWGDDTESLLHAFVGNHKPEELVLAIRDNAPADCDLDRLGFLIGILLNGFPGVDDALVARTLQRWTSSSSESEFRCAISEQEILYHCEFTRESLENTLGKSLENRWPQYGERIRATRQLWLRELNRLG